MPEYSSTTITPSDGVQVPGMNGSTSGNLLLSALKSYILSEKGLANGLASLDGNGKLTASQLPDLADDVIVVASYASLPATGTAGKIYITADNNKMYRWDPELTTPDYVELSIDLSEYAKIVDIQDGNIQAGVAVKAFQDAMGRAIITTYETKADASDLKDAIQGNTARIENLEQEHGGYVTVNYRGTYDVPTGKAKYALVESIIGKSRAWNNKLENGNFASMDGWVYNSSRATVTVADNEMTITTSVQEAYPFVYHSIDIPTGHMTLFYLEVYSPVAVDEFRWGSDAGNHNNLVAGWNTLVALKAMGFVHNFYSFYYNPSTSTTFKCRKAFCRDVTTIFPDLTSVEITSLGVAGLVKRCPDLLKYDGYGYSLVDTVVEGVKSKARNLFNINDFSAINGYFNGSVIAYSTDRKIVYFPCKPSTVYCATRKAVVTTERFSIGFTTELPAVGVSCLNIVSATSSQTIGAEMTITATSPADAKYLVCWVYWDNTTSALDSLCINVSDSQDGTYTPYWSPVTISLPSSVTLRSAGTGFEDTLDVETGEITLKCAEYTITGNESFSFYPSSSASLGNHNGVTFPIPAELSGIRTVLDAVGINDIGLTLQYANNDKTIYVSPSNIVMINDAWTTEATFVQNITGKHLVFALQDFGSTSISPVIDNTILTEGGGTINTIQTQSPEIDNSMDVGYLAL